jgi:Domain of Unknown Function (DUF928)
MSCLTYKTFKTSLVLLSWGMVMAFSLPSSAQTGAQFDLPSESASNHQQSQVIFEPPTDERADDSRGGASRNATACRNDRISEIPLTALIPGNNRGLTVASHPSFFVYVPQTSARQIYFSLKDENNVGIYQATLPISGNAGVVKIPMNPDQMPLETGKNYQWSVALMCQPAQPDMPWVTGQVERVQLEENIAPDLSSNPSIPQAVFYGQAGIWYDTLNILFQLNQSAGLGNASAIDASFLNQNWVNLLNSVGLNAIADQSLLAQP